jgi:hypothetical protein
MFSEGRRKAEAADVSSASGRRFPLAASLAASGSSATLSGSSAALRSTGIAFSLLLAEAAALALATASGKIPAFLFTAVRALLTF